MDDDTPAEAGAATPAGWFSAAAATFGDRVTGAREAAGMTREALSARLGVRLKTVIAWEEDMADPRANRLQMLAGLLGVSIRWLLTGEGEGPEGPGEGAPEVEAEAAGTGPHARLPQAALPVLAELRQLRAEMGQMADRLGRLEKRLRALVTEDVE